MCTSQLKLSVWSASVWPECNAARSKSFGKPHLVPLHYERILQASQARWQLLAMHWCTAGARQPAVCKVRKVAQRRLEDLPPCCWLRHRHCPCRSRTGLMGLMPRYSRFGTEVHLATQCTRKAAAAGRVSYLRCCAAVCRDPSRQQRRRSSPRGRTRSREAPQAVLPVNRPSCCAPAAQQHRRQEQGLKRRRQVPLLPPAAAGSCQADA